MVSRVVLVMAACAVAFACAPQAFAQTDAERAQLQLEEQRRVEREKQQQDDLKRLEQQRIDAERDAKKYQSGPTSTTVPSQPDYPRGPAPGAPTGGDGGSGTDYHTLPALTAANNPLLGRWRTQAPKDSASAFAPLGQLLGPEVQQVAGILTGGLVSARCKQMFGENVVLEFRPDSLVAIEPNGSTRLLHKVSYRRAGPQILVVFEGAVNIPYRFDVTDRNHANQEECPFERVSPQTASLTAPPPRLPPPPPVSGIAQLTVATGATSAGARFLPMASVPVFLVTQDPVVSLNNAHFRTPPGQETMHAWLDACRGNFQFCTVGMNAMTASAVKRAQTDASGRVDLGQLPAGRYYVVGMGATGNGGMFWEVPVDLHAGGNRVTLDQRNGNALKN